MPLHKNLTGAELHEPKGVAAAASGQVYVANGSGGGAWTGIAGIGNNVGEMYIPGNDTETVIVTQNVDVQVVAGWLNGDSVGVTFDTNHLVVAVTGLYLVLCNFTVASPSNNQTIHTHVAVNTGAGFVSHAHVHSQVKLLTGGDTKVLAMSGAIPLTAGDLVGVNIKNETSTANVVVDEGSLTIVFLG